MQRFDDLAVKPELPAQRFGRRGALASERVYGRGYQGPASEEVFEDLAGRCRLGPGTRILDVGSGLGGDAFRLSRRYGADVAGLDASPDMTSLCRERATAESARGVRFITGDARTRPFDPDSFDLVWTRDCGMYLPVPDKRIVWRRLFDALVPGGQVLLTDYCRGVEPGSAAFEAHALACAHHLVTPDGYRDILAGAGFVDVVIEDRSTDLQASMHTELASLVRGRGGFLADFTVEEYDALVHRWEQKLTFVEAGELVWLVLTATKPFAHGGTRVPDPKGRE
jgi:phosphoethanolamine N-methyltransferase